jgi:hypothetical protein
VSVEVLRGCESCAGINCEVLGMFAQLASKTAIAILSTRVIEWVSWMVHARMPLIDNL